MTQGIDLQRVVQQAQQYEQNELNRRMFRASLAAALSGNTLAMLYRQAEQAKRAELDRIGQELTPETPLEFNVGPALMVGLFAADRLIEMVGLAPAQPNNRQRG